MSLSQRFYVIGIRSKYYHIFLTVNIIAPLPLVRNNWNAISMCSTHNLIFFIKQDILNIYIYICFDLMPSFWLNAVVRTQCLLYSNIYIYIYTYIYIFNYFFFKSDGRESTLSWWLGGRPTGTRSPCRHGRFVVASYSMWGYTSHSRNYGTVGRMRELHAACVCVGILSCCRLPQLREGVGCLQDQSNSSSNV